MAGRFFEDVTVMEPLVAKGSRARSYGARYQRILTDPDKNPGRSRYHVDSRLPSRGPSKETERSACRVGRFPMTNGWKATADGALLIVCCGQVAGAGLTQKGGSARLRQSK